MGRACKCKPCAAKVSKRSYLDHHETRKAHLRAAKWARNRAKGAEIRFKLPPEFAELDVGVGYKKNSRAYVRVRERERFHTDDRVRTVNLIKASRRRTCKVVWADEEKIERIYADARRLTAETGVKHHVDHIIPLKHKLVCGLHVEGNLRVVPQLENLKKKNRFDPRDFVE